ncbi:uncharacterized protein [Epargyreus clarus]|uniref:uncharacterized protein isoform X2 n=1 Tax=Epargyreus clarus TaxID=520877 RepID=UPI003C2B3EF4
MAHDNRTPSEPKFTRGEKCIFIHLVLTFVMIMVLVIVYGLHLYLVSHTQYSIFNTRRSISDPIQNSRKREINVPEIPLVGYLFLNLTIPKIICNTLLLRRRWSLCPAHCVVMRAEPELAHLFFSWAIKYRIFTDSSGSVMISTRVRRSIAHPYFDRDSFANNIGLLEHTESLPTQAITLNNAAVNYVSPSSKMFIVGWEPNVIEHNEYGAVIFNNTKPIGFFSWGESIQTELPLVIVNDTLFQDWLIPLINF